MDDFEIAKRTGDFEHHPRHAPTQGRELAPTLQFVSWSNRYLAHHPVLTDGGPKTRPAGRLFGALVRKLRAFALRRKRSGTNEDSYGD